MSQVVRNGWTHAVVAITACGVAASGLGACASIAHGNKQDVAISSVPAGAKVTVDNLERGTTPVVAKLTRKDVHVVRVEMAGYKPFEATLRHKVDGWFWGNILIGGLIGIGIDAIDGAMYKLSPDQVSAALESGQASVLQQRDGLYIVAALEPQSDWVRIGQLEQE